MTNLTDEIYYLLTDENCPINFLNNYEALQCAKMIAEYIMPAINTEPVVHAHWVNERYDGCRKLWTANCTSCGSESVDERYRGVSEFHKCCHWCGAKMDEKVEKIICD